MVDSNGLVLAVETTPANCHDSKPLLGLLEKAHIQPGIRAHADKAYSSQKLRDALKSRGIRNDIQNKASRNNPLTQRQLQRNRLITKARSLCRGAHLRQPGTLVQWQNPALPQIGQSACPAYAIGGGA